MKRLFSLAFLLQLLPYLIALCTFGIALPSQVLWRDTGEFLLSAYYLDVSHPAGFPLYAQLANLFTLIPFGPIALRVHCFSLLCILLYCWLSQRLITLLLRQAFRIDRTLVAYCAPLPALLTLLAPVMLKQCFSAEVYVLNCVGIQLLILLFAYGVIERDVRYVVVSAFFSGLLLGNHATIVLSYPPAVCFVLFQKRFRKSFLPGLFFAVFGLGVYAYVPIRSLQSPPLNTGAAASAERFVQLVSNKRDRALRGQPSHMVAERSMSIKEHMARLALRFIDDMHQLAKEGSYAFLALGGVGACILLFHRPLLAVALLWIFLSSWYFFKGWQSDPWIVLLFLLSSASTVAVALIVQTMADISSRKVFFPVLLIGVALLTVHVAKHAVADAFAIKQYDLPRELSMQQLERLPDQTVYLSERSWFLLAYTRYILGYRADVLPLYTRSITHPEYFAPLQLEQDATKVFHSGDKGLDQFLQVVSPRAPIAYESQSALTTYLAKVTALVSSGQALVRYRQDGGIAADFIQNAVAQVTTAKNTLENSWQPLVWEGEQYIAAYAEGIGSLLAAQGAHEQRLEYYQQLCRTIKCNAVLLNNLAVSYLDLKHFTQAAEILEALLEMKLTRSQRAAILKNLSIAYNHQTSRSLAPQAQ